MNEEGQPTDIASRSGTLALKLDGRINVKVSYENRILRFKLFILFKHTIILVDAPHTLISNICRTVAPEAAANTTITVSHIQVK